MHPTALSSLKAAESGFPSLPEWSQCISSSLWEPEASSAPGERMTNLLFLLSWEPGWEFIRQASCASFPIRDSLTPVPALP